jgi:hypothetical protein
MMTRGLTNVTFFKKVTVVNRRKTATSEGAVKALNLSLATGGQWQSLNGCSHRSFGRASPLRID